MVVLVWDTSTHGWGADFHTNTVQLGLLLISTFSPGDSTAMADKQVHREAMGGLLAFHAALQSLDLRDCTDQQSTKTQLG